MDSRELGIEGERLAAEHLLTQGYAIKEKRWRWKGSEIDLICSKGGLLIFVEVKARTSGRFGAPEKAVTYEKERAISRVASAYCKRQGHRGDIRFDIISITLIPRELLHIEDAFFPGL